MNYLVDTNVLCEATRPTPSPLVVRWLRIHDGELLVNPIVLGEIEAGILRLDYGRRRSRMLEWYVGIAERIVALPIDVTTGHIWGVLLDRLRRVGRPMSIADSLLAATAAQYDLVVATRNTVDFRFAGVKVVNPFELN